MWAKAVAFLFALSLHLNVWADVKDPLNYPLKQYALMLGTALLGGLVSWVAKVRAGTLSAWNLMALVGELCTSAFAGLLCFWLCESFGFNSLMTASLVGISGHMGTRAIAGFEAFAQKKWGAVIGRDEEKTP